MDYSWTMDRSQGTDRLEPKLSSQRVPFLLYHPSEFEIILNTSARVSHT